MPAVAISAVEIFRVWQNSATVAEFCAHFKISRATACKLAAKHKLPKKQNAQVGRDKVVDPTPQEIKMRSAAIRRSWSPADRKKRGAKRSVRPPQHWAAPVYSYNSATGIFKGVSSY